MNRGGVSGRAMRGRRTVTRSCAVWMLVAAAVATADVSGQSGDEAAIDAVIGSAYIDGIQRNGDRAAIRSGFHPGFVMKVLEGDAVRDVSLEEWIGRLPPAGRPPRAEVSYNVSQTLIHGSAAVAEVEVFFDGRHRFTDLISLYRTGDRWRIVSKVFHREGS